MIRRTLPTKKADDNAARANRLTGVPEFNESTPLRVTITITGQTEQTEFKTLAFSKYDIVSLV